MRKITVRLSCSGYKDSKNGKYRGCFSVGGKGKAEILNTPEEAFSFKKNTRMGSIANKYADGYRGQIDEKVYNAMMEWKIEITD